MSSAGVPALSRAAQGAIMLAAFVLPTLLARAIGAGWGTSATFGQLAFVVAVTLAILAGRREAPQAGGHDG